MELEHASLPPLADVVRYVMPVVGLLPIVAGMVALVLLSAAVMAGLLVWLRAATEASSLDPRGEPPAK
jgi:hypothetical protein